MHAKMDKKPGAPVRRSERSEWSEAIPLTENEKAWLVFWRAITADRDPAPTLRMVQRVQRLVRRQGARQTPSWRAPR